MAPLVLLAEVFGGPGIILSQGGGVPIGFEILTDLDGSILTDLDGQPLWGIAA